MATDGYVPCYHGNGWYVPCYQSKDMTKVEQDIINGELVLELKRNIGNDPPTRWIIWESSGSMLGLGLGVHSLVPEFTFFFCEIR